MPKCINVYRALLNYSLFLMSVSHLAFLPPAIVSLHPNSKYWCLQPPQNILDILIKSGDLFTLVDNN